MSVVIQGESGTRKRIIAKLSIKKVNDQIFHLSQIIVCSSERIGAVKLFGHIKALQVLINNKIVF